MSSMDSKRTTRRQILKAAGAVAGGWTLSHVFPSAFSAAAPLFAQQAGAPANPGLEAARTRFGKAAIESTKLSDNLTLFRGPGGNVVVPVSYTHLTLPTIYSV